MKFPGDLVPQFVPRASASPGGLELGNIFEEHEVSWQLELETYRRCFPAQLAHSALQGLNRRTCARLLRDLAAKVHLPVESARFSQQQLDLKERRWAEREDYGSRSLYLYFVVLGGISRSGSGPIPRP